MQFKQRILTILAMTVLAVSTPTVFAEVKIAVVDVQSAILQSEEAKRLLAQLNSEFKGDRERLQALRAEGTSIQEQFQKNAEVMSDAEKRRLQKDFETKNNDYIYEAKKLQRRMEERQAEMFGGIDAKVQKAIEELVLQEDYDMILPRQAALYVGELYNITRKVTEKLNELDKK